MKDVTEAFSTVYVSGDFNGWSGDANALSDDDADGIWTGTITTTKDSIEYKFQSDGWAIQENLTEGDACTKTTGAFTNRFLVVSENVEVPAV
jgi:1,4-alpha-glucan branching enzyme